MPAKKLPASTNHSITKSLNLFIRVPFPQDLRPLFILWAEGDTGKPIRIGIPGPDENTSKPG